jgi:enoyl-CoA hydratase
VADVVLFEVAHRIATVTLNRPEARNALSSELMAALGRVVGEADARDDVDVLILTGADPAFCAGLDLKELGEGLRRRTVLPPTPAASTTAIRPTVSIPVVSDAALPFPRPNPSSGP